MNRAPLVRPVKCSTKTTLISSDMQMWWNQTERKARGGKKVHSSSSSAVLPLNQRGGRSHEKGQDPPQSHRRNSPFPQLGARPLPHHFHTFPTLGAMSFCSILKSSGSPRVVFTVRNANDLGSTPDLLNQKLSLGPSNPLFTKPSR